MDVQSPTAQLIGPGGRPFRAWQQYFSLAAQLLTAITLSGTTAQRPTSFLWVGRPYFDTTLGQPIWYDGSGWVDSAGAGA